MNNSIDLINYRWRVGSTTTKNNLILVSSLPSSNLNYVCEVFDNDILSIILIVRGMSFQLFQTFQLLIYRVQARFALACAARLADTLCPPEAPFGRLEVILVNYKGNITSKYVHLSFKIDITRKITKFIKFQIFDE